MYVCLYQGRAVTFLTGEEHQTLIENDYNASILRSILVLLKKDVSFNIIE